LVVDSLAAVAWQTATVRTQHVAVAIDARMGEVYAGLYAVNPVGEVQTVQAPWLADPDTLSASFAQDLDPLTDWVAAGDAFSAYPNLIESTKPNLWGRVETTLAPRADAIASIGTRLWHAGLAVSANEAAPIYIRNKVALDVGEQRALRVSRGQS
jgi:tRNA threonylcarbamoyladenosine biosynthesis protein TsaB